MYSAIENRIPAQSTRPHLAASGSWCKQKRPPNTSLPQGPGWLQGRCGGWRQGSSITSGLQGTTLSLRLPIVPSPLAPCTQAGRVTRHCTCFSCTFLLCCVFATTGPRPLLLHARAELLLLCCPCHCQGVLQKLPRLLPAKMNWLCES